MRTRRNRIDDEMEEDDKVEVLKAHGHECRVEGRSRGEERTCVCGVGLVVSLTRCILP